MDLCFSRFPTADSSPCCLIIASLELAASELNFIHLEKRFLRFKKSFDTNIVHSVTVKRILFPLREQPDELNCSPRLSICEPLSLRYWQTNKICRAHYKHKISCGSQSIKVKTSFFLLHIVQMLRLHP